MSETRVEIWKPVVGCEGVYEVSNRGRVRSLDRVVVNTNGIKRHLKGRILQPRPNPRGGYLTVALCRGGVSKTCSVHRLVLEAFRGECPPGKECCHFDDDPSNNRLDNLRWGTKSENKLDNVRNGNHNMARKTHCKRGHEFTEENTRTRATNGGRDCRACDRDRMRARRALERRAA